MLRKMDDTMPSLKTKLLRALATTNTPPSLHPPPPPPSKKDENEKLNI